MAVTKLRHVANPTALVAAALAASAGLLHIAVTRTHLAESTVDGVLMLVAAWTQLGFAVALLVSPTRLVRVVGGAALLAIVAGWAVARITGLPFGHSEGAPEEVRLLGTVATVLGGLSALVALAGVRPASDPTAPTAPPSPWGLAAAGTGLAALVSVAMVATPPGHAGGGHRTGGHGSSSHGAGEAGGHHGAPTSGTAGGAATGSGTAGDPATGSGTAGDPATGSGTAGDPATADLTTGGASRPAVRTPSPAPADDGHEHAPGEGH